MQIFTIPQLVEMLRVSEVKIRQVANDGKLRIYRKGDVDAICWEELSAYLSNYMLLRAKRRKRSYALRLSKRSAYI